MSKNNVMQPSESPVWKDLKPYRGKVKRSKDGGKHLGCIDGKTGKKNQTTCQGSYNRC
jgi:hypothetical protein